MSTPFDIWNDQIQRDNTHRAGAMFYGITNVIAYCTPHTRRVVFQ